MKKVIRISAFFNTAWGVLFGIFQLVDTLRVADNGHFDLPMEKATYIQNHGTAFDYYAGYAYFTSVDKKNYSNDEKWKFNIAAKTIVRIIYLFLYTILWLIGLKAIWAIKERHDYDSLSIEKKAEIVNPPFKPNWVASLFGIITTIISIYGIYYSFIFQNFG